MAKSSGCSPATYFEPLSCTVTFRATSADPLRKTRGCCASDVDSGVCATAGTAVSTAARAAAATFTTTSAEPDCILRSAVGLAELLSKTRGRAVSYELPHVNTE